REPLLPPSGGPDGGRADSGPGGDAGQPDACAPAEICNNGTDDDCDGLTDEGCECTPGATQPCDGACGATQTCGPDSRWGACTGGTPPTQYYADADGDGYGDPGTSMGFCDPPGSGWVLDATDC